MRWNFGFQILSILPEPFVETLPVIEIQAPNFSSLWQRNASFSCGVEKLFDRSCAYVVELGKCAQRQILFWCVWKIDVYIHSCLCLIIIDEVMNETNGRVKRFQVQYQVKVS